MGKCLHIERRSHRKSGPGKILRVILVRVPLCLLAGSILLVLLFRWVPVTYTPLMLKRSIQNAGVKDYRNEREWVGIEDISPNLIRAVIASEDSRFMQHKGFDFEELDKMLEAHRKRGVKIRGCSTISQQTAKNCFTFGSHSWLRKGVEAYYTVLIEFFWSKERIMEVYLNVAETGKGLFGVEAASMKYFGRHASSVTLRQAAEIACVLPDPLHRTPSYVAARMPGRLSLIVRRAYQTSASLREAPVRKVK